MRVQILEIEKINQSSASQYQCDDELADASRDGQ
jgi:hypothetical protein